MAEDGSVQSRPIQIEAQTATEYLIPTGLEAGTTIVTEGVSKLKDGQTIKPVRN
jgi:membrane fusion protein (multidrug efflux system)